MTLLRAFILILLCPLIHSGTLLASDLEMELRFRKLTYKIDETLRFEILYRNKGAHAMRFLPEAEYFSASVVKVRNLSSGQYAKVIPLGEMSVDFEELSKTIVTLKPGEDYSRKFRVRLASSLPADYDDQRAGLFLWFTGSSIELPSLGRYEVIAEYHCRPNHPAKRYLHGSPALWEGVAQSEPISLTFE